jgi:hypothetical protein
MKLIRRIKCWIGDVHEALSKRNHDDLLRITQAYNTNDILELGYAVKAIIDRFVQAQTHLLPEGSRGLGNGSDTGYSLATVSRLRPDRTG